MTFWKRQNYRDGKHNNGTVNLKLFLIKLKKFMEEKSLKGGKNKFGEKTIVHF